VAEAEIQATAVTVQVVKVAPEEPEPQIRIADHPSPTAEAVVEESTTTPRPASRRPLEEQEAEGMVAIIVNTLRLSHQQQEQRIEEAEAAVYPEAPGIHREPEAPGSSL